MAGAPTHIDVRLELPHEILEAERLVAGPDYSLGEAKALPPDPKEMEARFIEPVTLIASLTLAILAERVLHFVLARHGQGVMVDTTTKPPRVSALARVPEGFVLLIHPDGKPEAVRADLPPAGLADLLGKALKVGK
jgi:hypothetical protein